MFDVNDLADPFHELGIRDAIIIEFVRQVDYIRPVSIRFVSILGITPAVGIRIVTSVSQFRRSLVVGAAIQVAGAVVGEMVVGPVAVEYLQSNVRTVHTSWVVQS